MVQDKQAREAIARALLSSLQEQTRVSGGAVSNQRVSHWKHINVECLAGSALTADPLRQKLGNKAVGALIRGESAVIGLDGQDCKLLGEGETNERRIVIKASRLDSMLRRLDREAA